MRTHTWNLLARCSSTRRTWRHFASPGHITCLSANQPSHTSVSGCKGAGPPAGAGLPCAAHAAAWLRATAVLSAVALAAPASVEWGAAGHAFIDITAIVSRQEVGRCTPICVCVQSELLRSKRCGASVRLEPSAGIFIYSSKICKTSPTPSSRLHGATWGISTRVRASLCKNGAHAFTMR